jgi:hypothetical protein
MVADIVVATRLATSAASGRAETAAAAALAFENSLDLAVQAGWAYVQLLTFHAFAEVRAATNMAPMHTRQQSLFNMAASCDWSCPGDRTLCNLKLFPFDNLPACGI